jgi:hypothetical protein
MSGVGINQMKLTNIHIKNFRRLEDVQIDLDDGETETAGGHPCKYAFYSVFNNEDAAPCPCPVRGY